MHPWIDSSGDNVHEFTTIFQLVAAHAAAQGRKELAALQNFHKTIHKTK
jgi:hypothetical protein